MQHHSLISKYSQWRSTLLLRNKKLNKNSIYLVHLSNILWNTWKSYQYFHNVSRYIENSWNILLCQHDLLSNVTQKVGYVTFQATNIYVIVKQILLSSINKNTSFFVRKFYATQINVVQTLRWLSYITTQLFVCLFPILSQLI